MVVGDEPPLWPMWWTGQVFQCGREPELEAYYACFYLAPG